MPLLYDGQHVRLSLLGDEKSFPALLDVSAFLYDFNLLYEFVRLSVDPKYQDFHFSPTAYFRGTRPLDDSERLAVESLRFESPIHLSAVLPQTRDAIAAVSAFATLLVTIYNARLNRRKLSLETNKLENESRGQQKDDAPSGYEEIEEIRQVFRFRESERFVDRVTGRLADNPVRVKEIEFETVSSRTLRRSKSEEEGH